MHFTANRNRLALAIGVALAVGSAYADFSSEVELSSLTGSTGFKINGIEADDETGRFVSRAGDINGDGIDDLAIGAPYASTTALSAGSVHVVFGTNQGFPSPLNLSSLNGNNGFVVRGEGIFDSAGASVASAGDVNGDGLDDLLIGAPGVSPGANYAGASYVLYGDNGGFPNPLNLSDIDGSNGVVINGVGVYSESGRAVNSAGDINGDGIDDLVIGAPYAEGGAGASYVVFGDNEGLQHPLDLSTLDGSNGFAVIGVAAGDTLGRSVGLAGDVNDDGFDDLIIGAPLAGPSGANAGEAYIVYGTNQGFASVLDLADINGSDGFSLVGVAVGDTTGRSVGHLGDVNGDAIDDMIIGAPLADANGDASGSSYVVFGDDQGFSHPLNLSGLNGSNGLAIHGESSDDQSGTAASAAGDINFDGITDLVIGAPMAEPNGAGSGATYVVYGSDQSWPVSLNLSILNGTKGFRINGAGAGDNSGRSASAAGDCNHDGIVDLIIGAPLAAPNGTDSGAAYVLFGMGGANGDLIFSDSFE